MYQKILLILCLLLSGFTHAHPGGHSNQTSISSEQTIANQILIDVRRADEFNQEHIQGAILAPHTQIGDLISTITQNKNQPITLYCRSGRRAEIAKKVLQNLGYTHVTNAGGLEDLKNDGYPTVTP